MAIIWGNYPPSQTAFLTSLVLYSIVDVLLVIAMWENLVDMSLLGFWTIEVYKC